ncbi:MAG: hypothetical protein O3B27_03655 [Actinomycetota bacterium]|nr:hypothetical protein [Actinomycetota bacterium]MDA2948912.1 hypothetical protein [Actinomycetota bacterium]MDA2990644.1 hypothetical protein [Actinomycetota bacterium]
MKIKVLTAVTNPPTREHDDFSRATAGEICVMPAIVCDNSSCGCGSAVIGLVSHAPTTTATVAEADLSADDIDAMMNAYTQKAWGGLMDAEDTHALWQEMASIAAAYPLGAVLRFRAQGDHWIIRADRPAA